MQARRVGVDAELTHRRFGVKLGLVCAANARLARYSMGQTGLREILMRFFVKLANVKVNNLVDDDFTQCRRA